MLRHPEILIEKKIREAEIGIEIETEIETGMSGIGGNKGVECHNFLVLMQKVNLTCNLVYKFHLI